MNTNISDSTITTEELEALDTLIDSIDDIPEEVIEQPEYIIPPNSYIVVDETTSRFNSAIWFDKIQSQEMIIAGVGGIGSYCCFLLARLKPSKIYIYDPDIVEQGNMSGQLFSRYDVGRSKVAAISDMTSNYAEYYRTYTVNTRYTITSATSNIMICGFDNMEARKIYFENWLMHVNNLPEEERINCLFIDGRLAAEEFQVLCIRGDDEYNINRYQNEFLFSDDEADETICSYKQTTFMANMIGSVIVNLYVNFAANLCEPLIDRDLPFYTEYNAELMYFKTVN